MVANTTNTRIDDHFEPGNRWLVHVDTDAVGNYVASSIDSDKLGKIEARVSGNGNYSVDQQNHDGHRTTIQEGGHKTQADSVTSTVTGHIDQASDGGVRSNHAQGMHTESGESTTSAHNGSHITASKMSHKNLSQEGNGHHVMKGDQSMIVDEGGMHFGVTKDFTVTATGTIHQDASNEYSVKVGGNEAHTAGGKVSYHAESDINIESATSITLKVGSSTIVMTPGKITITSPEVEFIQG